MKKENTSTQNLFHNYWFAIFVFVVATIFSGLIVYNNIVAQEVKSSQINLLGRQRMRSQKIAKLCVKQLFNPADENIDRIKYQLKNAKRKFIEAHHNLNLESNTLHLVHYELNKDTRYLFTQINPVFDTFIKKVDSVDFVYSEKDKKRLIKDIFEIESAFLPLMDNIVTEFQDDTNEHLEQFKLTLLLIVLVFLLMTFLIAFFVFKPMAFKNNQLINELNFNNLQLKNTIEEISATEEELKESNNMLMYKQEEYERLNIYNNSLIEDIGDANIKLRILNEDVLNAQEELKQNIEELNAQQEEVLRQNAYINSINNALDASSIVSITDSRGIILKVNSLFCHVSGYQQDELIGKTHKIVNSGYHPEEFWREMWQTIKRGQSWRAEVKNKAKDGSYYWVDTVINPIYNSNDEIVQFLSIRNIITDKKENEKELIKIKSLLEQSTRVAKVGAWDIDFIENKILWSDINKEIFEIENDNDIPTLANALDFFKEGESRTLMQTAFRHSVATGEPFDVELQIVTAKGNEIWVNSIGNPEMKNGTCIKISGITQDINERKNAEFLIKKAVDEAKAATNAKSQFLANMSHEIRTPLNGILGFADLLSQTTLDEIQSQYVNTVNLSANLLLRIINDILDFSKIEAGKLELEILDLDIKDKLQKTIDILLPLAKNKNLDLRFNFECNNTLVKADSIRLQQIVTNLLSNAIKFTSEGSVTLILKQIESNSSNKSKYYIAVKDSGIGISPEQQQRLFQAFSQADVSTSRKFGGTGLGLVISNMLAQKMNSEIKLKSEEGNGSEFYFEIEFDNANLDSTQNKNNISEIDFSFLETISPKILIAEDVPVNMKLIKIVLSKMIPNAILLEAKDGFEVVEQFKTQSPNFIFMDIQMPGKDGYGAVKDIRALNTSVPIVALTADAIEGEKEKCLNTGMNEYLTKPLDKVKIKEVLAKFLS